MSVAVYTDHSLAIDALRESTTGDNLVKDAKYLLAADLLELHDNKSISLDNWPAAKAFIEYLVRPIIDEALWTINPNRA